MRLLIVGPLDGHITTASKIAFDRGAKVAHVRDVGTALQALRSGRGADLAMIDVTLDVGRFIAALAEERIHLPVIACGVAADTGAAVRAIKAGAREYVPLPPDAELIAAVLEAVGAEDRALIADDPAMRPVLRLADQVAPSQASVLVTGESGTGKEVLARYIHARSRRAEMAFVSVNCAAIPDHLLESELFGHEKGAFTGAVSRRIGKFEEAHGGTLLLDEIGEMDPRLQAKLLRAVQEREIDRVGGTAPVKVDIRLIATTNRDLGAEVAAGRFREDLYYRLNVLSLHLPPLRERPGDIPSLARHFATKYAAANGLPDRALHPDAVARLQAHRWRGNVRELENTMHRAVLLAEGASIGAAAILLTELGSAAPGDPVDTASGRGASGRGASGGSAEGDRAAPAGMVGRSVAEVERELILGTLDHCLGNRTHAATILGISIRTLRNKLKLYTDQGVPVTPPRDSLRPVFQR